MARMNNYSTYKQSTTKPDTKGSNMDDKEKSIIKKIIIGAGLFVALLVFSPLSFVGTGERGVVTHFGKVQEGVLDEGVHLILPLITSVHKLSVRVQKAELTTEASSKDLQLVKSVVAINYHISPDTVNKLYQEIGDEDAVLERILTPTVSEVFKAATAQKTAEEIVTLRGDLSLKTQEMLKTDLAKYNIMLDGISIVDLDFTEEFSHAVEQKQIAEQQSKQAEYVANKATADAKAAVNTAKGEAEAMLTLAKAQAQSQTLLRTTLTPELLKMKWIEKWNGNTPTVVTGSGGGMILNMPSTTGSSKE